MVETILSLPPIKESCPRKEDPVLPDPEGYLDGRRLDSQRYPSYWAFPERQWMREANNFIEVRLDQGPTSHERRKPTTLGANIYEFKQLQGLRGPGAQPEKLDDQAMSIREKVMRSRRWASWSDGLKKAIAVARTCLEACGQGRHHRRIVTPDSYTLAVDLSGPFEVGEDQLGEGRYLLIGS